LYIRLQYQIHPEANGYLIYFYARGMNPNETRPP